MVFIFEIIYGNFLVRYFFFVGDSDRGDWYVFEICCLGMKVRKGDFSVR